MVFSALDEKTAQFNFASSSHLVYNWMQGTLTFDEEKKIPLDFLSDQVACDIGRSI